MQKACDNMLGSCFSATHKKSAGETGHFSVSLSWEDAAPRREKDRCRNSRISTVLSILELNGVLDTQTKCKACALLFFALIQVDVYTRKQCTAFQQVDLAPTA
jgi:hypothetical protein